MLDVLPAQPEDITALLALESSLFREDAGQHDPFSDTTWPEREGREDLEQLMESPDGIVLAARESGDVVGLLVGYAAQSSPTRQPVQYAILRTMYVSESARRIGAATLLTERFLDWARDRGCAEAQVDHYAANHAAREFYESVGFLPRSVSRVISL